MMRDRGRGEESGNKKWKNIYMNAQSQTDTNDTDECTGMPLDYVLSQYDSDKKARGEQ